MKRPVIRALWGWTDPVGRVLTTAVALGAVAILLTAPPSRPGPGTPQALRVDPNTAPEAVLLALPRIGPARAGAIVEARRRTVLRSPGDLDRQVRGFGPVTVRAVEPYLRFPDADSTP